MRKELLLSIALAIGIIATALWVADRSLNTKPSPEQLKIGRYTGVDSGKIDTAETSEPQYIDVFPNASSTSREMAATSGISKCVINGKTVYSDNGCPNGAKIQSVSLHDTAGIVSPPKEKLADLKAKRIAAERAYAFQAQPQVTAIGQSGSGECEELDRRIAELDSMARQPHSGTMQDWIKSERKTVRDREFAIRC